MNSDNIVWCVFWSSLNLVCEDIRPCFLHSVHASAKGALRERRRLARLARLPGARNAAGRVVMFYDVRDVPLEP